MFATISAGSTAAATATVEPGAMRFALGELSRTPLTVSVSGVPAGCEVVRSTTSR